ncbi:hypothetical protein [Almyronema epifaneia]|uniref:SPOR domain-containing protein n=1 Tax=Almyronema epifaneia S1 TaxID=2991925 RepID=A0ABW6IFK2_9CYAN
MKLTQTLGLAIGLSATASTIPVGQAAEVIGGPTGSQFTIESLANGNYRFCSDRPPTDVQRVSGVCFRFRKQGEAIVGNYYYPYEGSSLCVKGQVNGNTVTGQGVERLGENSDRSLFDLPQDRSAWRSDTFDDTFLQVGRSQLVLQGEQPDHIRYRSLLLNLNNFYWFNAGTVLPPQSCLAIAEDSTANRGYTTVPDTFRLIGESEYYQQPIYLNQDRIQPVSSHSYRYSTRIGLSAIEAESDLIVDCNQPDQVRWLRSRYYTEAGELSEVETVDQVQPVSLDGPNADKYRANQIVCRQAEADTATSPPLELPENIVYERYINHRFNFSVRYPVNVVTPQPAPTNNDGRIFESARGQITLRVFGRHNSASESLAALYQQALQRQGREVTDQIRGDRYFVVSGYEAGQVFYEKSVLENQVFKSLILHYDSALQPDFDPVAAEIAASFP